MNKKEDLIKLKKLLENKAKLNEPLTSHTFLKIGGPADLYFEAQTNEQLVTAVVNARRLGIDITMLGQGSNILVSDKGVRGLVLVIRTSRIKIVGEGKAEENKDATVSRWESDSGWGTFKYEFKDLDYDESDSARVLVEIDSGVDLPYVSQFLINKGITGLQWYAGIPGTIGGAVFNNIHGGTHFLSEVLDSVEVLGRDNEVSQIGISDLGIDYDKSRFQESGEIILKATFKLFRGNTEKAKYVFQEWAKRKSLQPRNAPGCAFHNLTQKQKDELGIPTTSAGFVIEHLLKMTGFRIGDAAISKDHHNFIVNDGKATASEYLAVMKEIYRRAKTELGIELVPEIFFMGFDSEEIKEFKRPVQKEIRKTRNKEIKSIYNDSKRMFAKNESEQ